MCTSCPLVARKQTGTLATTPAWRSPPNSFWRSSLWQQCRLSICGSCLLDPFLSNRILASLSLNSPNTNCSEQLFPPEINEDDVLRRLNAHYHDSAGFGVWGLGFGVWGLGDRKSVV